MKDGDSGGWETEGGEGGIISGHRQFQLGKKWKPGRVNDSGWR